MPPPDRIPPDPKTTAPQAASPDGVRPDEVNGAPTDGQQQPSKRRRGVGGWILRILLGLVGFLVAVVLLILLVLQTNWGARKVSDALLGLANPFDTATIEIGRIQGNWVSGLQLYDVAITRDDTVRMAHVDTVRVRYRLLSIFDGRIHLRELFLGGAAVTMRQQPDSTWDLLAALRQDTTQADTAAAFVLQVDEARVNRGQFAMQYYTPGRPDSTLRIDALNTRLADIRLAEETSLVIDRLAGEVTLPTRDEALAVTAKGVFDAGRLVFEPLTIDGPGSQLVAEGGFTFPTDTRDELHDIDLSIRAEPLTFGDLRPFVTTLPEEASTTFELNLDGSLSRLEAVADARFSDGATAALSGVLTLTEGSAVAYDFEAQTRRLNPAFFTGDPAMQGRINASIVADLQGTDFAALDGTAEARVFDSRYGEYDLDRTVLEARFTDGRARIDLNTGLRGARLALNGTARPFAETPTYDLSGRLADFDLGRFSANPEQSSNVSGTFRLEGRGFDPQTATATATIDLDPSRINRFTLNDGTLTARLDEGALGFRTRLEFPEGLVAAEGTARLGDELRYRIREGRFENLDVAALSGDTTRSSLTGTFSLAGSGTDPATDLRLDDLRLSLEESVYGPYQINAATLAGTLRGGRLNFDAVANLDGGAFDVVGYTRLFDTTPTLTLTSGSFENVDVGRLTQNPNQQSNLTGTIDELTLRGFDPQTMRLDARLNLRDSQYNRQQIDAAVLVASLRGGTLDFEARLETPEGTTTLAGGGDIFGDTPTFALREGGILGLNLGALLGIDGLDTSLNGTLLEFELEGSDPQTMTLVARLELDRSRINDAVVLDGLADISLRDGFIDTEALLTLEDGRTVFEASGRFFDEVPTYRALGTFSNVDVAALAGIDTTRVRLSADFGVEGTGLDPYTMQLQARFDASEARFDSLYAGTLAARFRLDEGLLTVDTLEADLNIADIEGGGTVALFDTLARYPSDFRLRAEVGDARPVRRFIDAEVFAISEGQIEGRLFGEPGTLRFDADAAVSSLVFNDIRVNGLDVRAEGAFDADRAIQSAVIDTELNYFSIPALAVRYTEIDIDYRKDDLDFSASLTVDQRRDARIQGSMDLRPDSQRVVFDDLTFHLDEDRWSLLQQASIAYGNEYRVSNLLLFSDDQTQQLAIDGVIDPNGEQNLILTLEAFRIGAVADLLGFRGLGGTINGFIDLTGPAVAPNLTGQLELDVESFQNEVGDLDLAVRYDSLRLHFDQAVLTHTDGSTLALSGYLPMDLRLSEADAATGEGLQVRRQDAAPESAVALRLDADAFNIGWVEPFLDPESVSEVEGRLDGAVLVEGTVETPDLSGDLTFREGRLGLPALGLAYTDISAEAALRDDEVALQSLTMRSGPGSATASGTIDLTELTLGAFDITARAENFRAIDNELYSAVVAADLELRGTTQSPQVTGAIDILSADIRLADEAAANLEPVELTERDLLMLEQYFGLRVTEADTSTFDIYEAATMDLRVRLERDVWLRARSNPEMNIQFTGALDMTKPAYQDIQLFGTIEVIPDRSNVRQFGKRFVVSSGEAPGVDVPVTNTLTFNGLITNPYLSLAAVNEVRSRSSGESVNIWLIITGRLDDLNIRLASDATDDYANIISYLATGRPASEAFQLGGFSEVGQDLALSQVAAFIEGAAGEGLGLDVVEIRQEAQGATITAGKFLSRKFFASVSWPVNVNTVSQEPGASTSSLRVVTLEYELFDWLLARVTSRGTKLGFNLFFEYAY